MKFCYLTSMLLLFSVASLKAQSWLPVGPDDFENFSDVAISFPRVAINSSGVPYIVYSENDNGYKITVKKYNGIRWEVVGAACFSEGEAWYNDIAIDDSGTPYVVYQDKANGWKATVQKFNGTTWEVVGMTGFSEGMPYTPSIAIDGSGVPYVAYCDYVKWVKNYLPVVKKFNGTTWEDVGTGALSTWKGDYTRISIDDSGTPYVVYADEANGWKATVQKFNGTTWEVVGTAGISVDNAGYTDIAIDGSGTPYVVYQDKANDWKTTVQKFNGTTWEVVGTAGFSAEKIVSASIALNNSGVPYVAYQEDWDGDYYGNKTFVQKFNGTAWEEVDAGSLSEGTQFAEISLALDGAGVPYTISLDNSNNFQGTVKKYNGTAWEVVDVAGISGGDISNPCIAFDNSGIPYLAYRDNVNGQKVTVKKYVGGQWETVGAAGFSAGTVVEVSLDFGPSGTPYVAYRDNNQGGRATVKKFDGSNWVVVGTEGFSLGRAEYLHLAVDPSGIPCVAYRDPSRSFRCIVQKYDGSGWVYLKSSGGTVRHPSVDFASDGTLYLAYVDKDKSFRPDIELYNGSSWVDVGGSSSSRISSGAGLNLRFGLDPTDMPYVVFPDGNYSNKLTVKKYDGVSWVTVGTEGFTPGEGAYPTIAFDGAGTPYVAYVDAGNGNKITVKKYDGLNWVDVGDAGISKDSATRVGLALNNLNTAFVAYSANGLFVKAFTDHLVLPLQFLTFSGTLQQGQAALHWQTENEINTAEFVIERSTDGKRFRETGRVAAAGTPGKHLYTFTDVLPREGAVWYYRIRQADNNNRYSYSPILLLKKQGRGNRVALYPNPARGKVTINLNTVTAESVRLQLLDIGGRVLQSLQWNLPEGVSSRQLDVSGLATGLYYLKIAGKNLNLKAEILKR